MSDDRAKTPRTLLIADHLWEAFSTMAEEMGSDRDALLNQALYTFARLNGFLVPSDLSRLGMVPRTALTDSGRLRIAPAPAPEPTTLDPDEQELPPAARAQAAPERLSQVAGGLSRRAIPPEASDATTMDLSGVAGFRPPRVAVAGEPPPQPAAAVGQELVLLADDGSELERVRKDRFIIGRGKHCDLVINSGKVSREHAAIVREGNAWFIEDLGSSNGTWFDARRITRRQIQDGDEYFVCAEKLRCSLR